MSGAGSGVHHGGVSHGLQPVQGDGGQTQCGDVDGDSLRQMLDDKVDFRMAIYTMIYFKFTARFMC